LKVSDPDGRERFESAAETALETLGALSNAADDAMIAREHQHYLVGLGKVVSFENEAFGFDKRHLALGNKVQDPAEYQADDHKLRKRFYRI
jgi:hypothetical protein